MRESQFQRKIIEHVKQLNVTLRGIYGNEALKCIKLEPSNHDGLPDLILLFEGRVLFLENKKDKDSKSNAGKESKRQQRFRKWATDHRFIAKVLRPTDDFTQVIDQFITAVETMNNYLDNMTHLNSSLNPLNKEAFDD